MSAGRVCVRKARFSEDHLGGGGPDQAAVVRRRPNGVPQLTVWQLSTAKRFMLDRLSDRLSIGDVALALALSKSYFVRSFTNTVGVAPYNWLVEQRLDQARHLLTRTTMPLAQIALECGFSDQSHFTNAFNRRVGTTPSRLRKGERAMHLQVAWDDRDSSGLQWARTGGLIQVDS